MTEISQVFVIAAGKTVEVTDKRFVSGIVSLFTANPTSQSFVDAMGDDKLVAKLTTGAALIRVVRSDDEDKTKNQTVEMSKKNIAALLDHAKKAIAEVKACDDLKVVAGEFGKRGKTAMERDYDVLNG